MGFRHLSPLLALVSIATVTSGFEDNSLYGISHVTQVVSDLTLSTQYYTEMLGGMLVPELSTSSRGVNGDEHFYRFFYKEYSDSLSRSIPFSQLDVPDIRTRGDHNVRWNFIMFNNILVQLLQFVNRFTLQPYIRKDPRVGNAFVTSNHMSFAADQNIVPIQQVNDFIQRFNNFPRMERNKKGFITSGSVNSFQDRQNKPLQSFMQKFSESLYLSTTRGPDGERFEILYRRGNGSDNDLRECCRFKAVGHEMLDTPTKNKYHDTLSKRLAAFNHFSVVVDDMAKTDQFYIDILGGKKNRAESSTGAFELDPYMRNLVFQDEILEALATNYQPDESFGIPTLKYDTKPMFDFSFIQFGNTYFEPYHFQVNDINNNPQFLTQLYRTWSSPAYINNNHCAFWVKDDVNLQSFVQNVEGQSLSRGLNRVFFNQAPSGSNTNMYDSPFTQGDLQGYNYLYFKGPSGEQIVLSQFKGNAKRALQAAMEEYGALSTAFPSTNPWNWDGFQRTCARLLD